MRRITSRKRHDLCSHVYNEGPAALHNGLQFAVLKGGKQSLCPVSLAKAGTMSVMFTNVLPGPNSLALQC